MQFIILHHAERRESGLPIRQIASPTQAVSLLAPAFWMNYSFTLGNTILIGKVMAFLNTCC